MNFDFPDELKQLRQEARKFLTDRDAKALCRRSLETKAFDLDLWREMGGLGWAGASIPEAFGGSGMGPLAVCALAEEIGYAAAPVPFSSSVYLATEALLAFGTDEQKQRWLPLLATGDATGTLAIAEGPGSLDRSLIAATVVAGRLSGTKLPVPGGAQADFAIVVAKDEDGGNWLHLVELGAAGVTRADISVMDQSQPQARLDFTGVASEPLGNGTDWQSVRLLLDRAAAMMAFEQIGGAQAALEMARDYALQRYAFGRNIGSFQAIKHKLADIYVAIELARSSAYYGAWALHSAAPELPSAAAMARIAATDAAWLATKENIQVHGGVGYTWELDCHLFYRRAKSQALALGSGREWKARLMHELSPKTVSA